MISMLGQGWPAFLAPIRKITNAINYLIGGIKMLTQKRLKELLHYAPATGVFTWRVSPRYKIHAGTVAGCPHGEGYRVIRIRRVGYLAQRLAWLYMKGRWPIDEADHKNGIRDDNRWKNLREVTRLLNNQNQRRARKDNKLGCLGVCARGSGFQAKIQVDGAALWLGTFATKDLAHMSYLDAKRKFHEGCTI